MYCFSRFCRLCFRRDCKLLNLYTKDDDMITFNEKLKSCIPEIVCDEDRMPNFICDTCCSKLKKGYEFKLMCVKNHIALRDYAKQLLKYMENPAYNQSLFNIRATRSETDSNESDLQDKDKIVDSEHDSDCSDDENDHERKLIDESNDSLEVKDEPLALVKTNRNSESCNGENSYTPYVPVKAEPDVTIKRIKLETDSEDDSQYKGEDLTKKPGCNSTPIPESAFTDSCIKERLLPQREFLPRDVPGYNMTNDMVMKYLKLEYTEREENNRNNDVGQTAEHPENLCTADSETDCDTRHDESSTWNTAVREEPKKMKTRTKDKYRIVYTENQRLELEKEFIVSRYITTSRKIQLSASLNLSQRQIKIWFQNRRAKERKQVKRSVEQLSSDGNTDPCTTSCDTPTNTAEHNNVPLLPTKEIVEVQKELFALQRQQEVYMQQHKDTKNNIGELYKHKHELLSQRLQVLMHQQKEIGNSKQSEASCH